MSKVFLCRHGETEWNVSGQHTSTTDIPLTDNGRKQAELLKKRLQGKTFAKVYVSPYQRSRETCELAGFGPKAIIDPDFSEWNYGEFEGLTTEEIHKKIPDWTIFRYGAPGGESIQQVEERAKRAVHKLRSAGGDALVFSHGHFTRVLGAVWIGLSAKDGQSFTLSNASLCILGYEREAPAFRVWNDTCHLTKK